MTPSTKKAKQPLVPHRVVDERKLSERQPEGRHGRDLMREREVTVLALSRRAVVMIRQSSSARALG